VTDTTADRARRLTGKTPQTRRQGDLLRWSPSA